MEQYNSSFSDSWSTEKDFTNNVHGSISNSGRDFTVEFTTNQIFEDKKAMLDWARNVGKQNGFAIAIGHSTTQLRDGKMPRCVLICTKGGQYKQKAELPPEGDKKKRDTSSNKCMCPFMLQCASQPPYGVMWSLKVINGSHNHKLAVTLNGHEFPSRLDPFEKELVDVLRNITAPKEILGIIKKRDPSNTTGIKSIYNAKAAYKKKQLGGLSEFEYIIREINEKGYMYDCLKDEYTDEVTDILWVHPTSLELSINFPMVLVIDATYKVHKEDKPLLEVVGITSTYLTYSIMFALLSNEKKDRFIWALSTLKRWMVNKGAVLPSVIITDRDLALLGATDECFPNARHILCIWHINQCLVRRCSRTLGTRLEEFQKAWHKVIHSRTPGILSLKWNAMCRKFSQEYGDAMAYLWNTWLFPYKERFVDAYVNTSMHLGSHSSQRAESAHSVLKQYIGDTSVSFLKIFQKIDDMLTIQFGRIQGSFELSFNKVKHRNVHDPMFNEIAYRISLWKIAKIDAESKKDVNRCNYTIKITHGLPCAHDSVMYRDAGIAIPLNAIHNHWSTLYMIINERTNHEVHEDMNPMNPSSEEYMTESFDYMSYPTEQMDNEQNNGYRHSQGGNMRDHFVQEFPQVYQPYISHCVNVLADGNCGFRAIAAQCHGSEEEWRLVRHNLAQEILQHWTVYDNLYLESNILPSILARLNYYGEEDAIQEHWMEAVGMGVIIASAYHVVLHTFDNNASACYTHLPLRPLLIPVEDRIHIAIGRVHCNHFVQVFLHPGYPVPPILRWRSPENAWARDYQNRIQLWNNIMKINTRPQFGGTIG